LGVGVGLKTARKRQMLTPSDRRTAVSMSMRVFASATASSYTHTHARTHTITHTHSLSLFRARAHTHTHKHTNIPQGAHLDAHEVGVCMVIVLRRSGLLLRSQCILCGHHGGCHGAFGAFGGHVRAVQFTRKLSANVLLQTQLEGWGRQPPAILQRRES
jgi:hypothetical protein